MMASSHLAALRNRNGHFWLVIRAHGSILYFPNNQHSIDNSAKDDMFPIQEITFCCCYEKLAPICILPTVGHREKPWLIMLQTEILVSECGARVNRHTPSPVTIDEITTLHHKIFDDPVEL